MTNPAHRLKIGWLFPYSGIFGHLKRDLQQGLECALKKEGVTVKPKACSAFIQSGAPKDTEAALRTLLFHEDADLIIGVLSTKVALSIVPILNSRQTPVIILDLGADIPHPQLSSDYLFYNSLHLWKSQWVMGKWAQQKYGGEPSINMSFYEGGYGLHESFRLGTFEAGAGSVKLNVIRSLSAQPETGPLIQYIRDQHPLHAHALLSGREGEHFLRLFYEQGLAGETGLTVNPFMAEDGLFGEWYPGMDLYNAMTWSTRLDSPANRLFIDTYTAGYGEAPNAFALLAFETGLALAAAIKEQGKRIRRDELALSLGQVSPAGPRGEIHLSTRPLRTSLPVYIRQPVKDPSTGKPVNRIIDVLEGIEWDDPGLSIEQSYLSGWQNPYLCV